jgi:Icc-related predicted phosphoesterase
MRIVAMADTHMFHDTLDVPDGDVLVHAGDMTATGSLEELRTVNAFLAALPHRHKLIVAGNHDRALEREPAEARAVLTAGTYLEGDTVEIEGVRFWGGPWQPEFFSWAFNVPRGEGLARLWAQIPADTDVVVTHGPPLGIGDVAGEPHHHVGCADLLHRMMVLRPRLHVFGHIHQSRGQWELGSTVFANVTTDECCQPCTVIDL